MAWEMRYDTVKESEKPLGCRDRSKEKGQTEPGWFLSGMKNTGWEKTMALDEKKNSGLESWEVHEHRRWLRGNIMVIVLITAANDVICDRPLCPQTSSPVLSVSSCSISNSHRTSGKRSFA